MRVVSGCCSAANEQFFSYITFQLYDDDDIRFVPDQHA